MWQATSPSTHEGDTLTAVFTNKGSSALTVWPSIIIMDHMNHHNESVVDEEFELPAGGERTFTAVNDYGVANHFSTRMLAATGDPAVLGIEISMGFSAVPIERRCLPINSSAVSFNSLRLPAALSCDCAKTAAHRANVVSIKNITFFIIFIFFISGIQKLDNLERLQKGLSA